MADTSGNVMVSESASRMKHLDKKAISKTIDIFWDHTSYFASFCNIERYPCGIDVDFYDAFGIVEQEFGKCLTVTKAYKPGLLKDVIKQFDLDYIMGDTSSTSIAVKLNRTKNINKLRDMLIEITDEVCRLEHRDNHARQCIIDYAIKLVKANPFEVPKEDRLKMAANETINEFRKMINTAWGQLTRN